MQPRKRSFKATISAAALVLLNGCGGGGGDVPSPPSFEDAYDIGRIFFFLLTGSGRWTVGGIGSDGAFYEITISFEPDGDSFFPLTPGLPGTRSKQTTTLRRNGVLIATVSETTFFTVNTLAIQGTTRSDGTCSQVSAATPPPASAEPGNGGTLDASIDYTSCTSGAAVSGTTSRTWSVEAGNTPVDFLTVYFCSNETNRNAAGQVVGTESICLEINRDGSLDDKARITRTGPGNFSLTARN
jgi:hypothetical protein